MARFQPNTTITTREPRIRVDPGLPPGTYRFQLVVADDRGRKSAVAEVVVQIVRQR